MWQDYLIIAWTEEAIFPVFVTLDADEPSGKS